MIDDLAHDGIAYVPFFPLGGFTPAPPVQFALPTQLFEFAAATDALPPLFKLQHRQAARTPDAAGLT